MNSVPMAKLKASLSEYLRRVKAGEEVMVTERGRTIAKLVPMRRSDNPPEYLPEMERQRLVRLGGSKLPKTFWKLPRPRDPKGLVVKAVLGERDDGR